MYHVSSVRLRTRFIFRQAVFHALVLRHESVVVSRTATVASAIQTAFDVCVVVPSIIDGLASAAFWCKRATTFLYHKTNLKL